MEYREFENALVCRISPTAWQIREPNEAAAVYMYLITGRDRALLIDTGYGRIPLWDIVNRLTDLPVTVVLTHGHFDHIGAAGAFPEVYLHEKDRDLFRHHLDLLYPGTGDAISQYPPCLSPKLFGDDAYFDLGDRVIRVIPAPGHSLGSICLWDPEENLLYTGDTCCVGDVLLSLENAGRPEQYLATVQYLREFTKKHDIRTTWPGHHSCPVEPEILEEFGEMTQMLIRGELKGEPVRTPLGEARHASFGRIGIWY